MDPIGAVTHQERVSLLCSTASFFFPLSYFTRTNKHSNHSWRIKGTLEDDMKNLKVHTDRNRREETRYRRYVFVLSDSIQSFSLIF